MQRTWNQTSKHCGGRSGGGSGRGASATAVVTLMEMRHLLSLLRGLLGPHCILYFCKSADQPGDSTP